MTENEAKSFMLIEKECINRDCNRDCAKCDIVQAVDNLNNAYDTAIKALEEVQQYRAIGTPEECRAAMEKQTETLTVDKAKTIVAKAICIGCGYLADCKCDYKGGNCMVSKPMLESVLKSFDDWNRRANDGKIN
jgi:hypothetical protein